MANLTQLRMLEDLDGVVLVDKPVGIAFSTVVKTVKRKFNLVKVGHGGSLDAMASGLLVLLVGDANKYVDRVMGADRSYTGTLRLGATTDTGDIHGRSTPTPDHVTDPSEFRGDVFQTEPRFCSVRKEGTGDYEIADTGDHKQFLTHVYSFKLDGAAFTLVAAKNLIVRALANDMGATLVSLRRTKVGPFAVEDAIPFERLLETELKDFPSCVKPVSSVWR